MIYSSEQPLPSDYFEGFYFSQKDLIIGQEGRAPILAVFCVFDQRVIQPAVD
jgi:hypothetical protein